MDRLEQLMMYYNDNPADSFLQYAIALEHIKQGDLESGRKYFEELVAKDPAYVGTYYHLAKLYRKMGLQTEAEQCYRNGIQVATELNDFHALGELKNAFTNFQMGLDDED